MTATVPAERPPSLWEDLLEIFYAPTAVFQRRRETPAFGLALVLFVLIMFGLTFAFRGLMEPVFDVEMNRSMAQAAKSNPAMTPEAIEAGKAIARKFVLPGVTVTLFVLPLLVGLVFWVIGKLFDSKAEIGQVMMVSTYAIYPRILESIISAVQMLVLPDDSITSRFSLSLGVGRFLDPSHQLLMAIFGRLDVFTLWITFLLGTGMAVMGRMPKGRAYLAAAVMWIVGGLLPVLGALRSGG